MCLRKILSPAAILLCSFLLFPGFARAQETPADPASALWTEIFQQPLAATCFHFGCGAGDCDHDCTCAKRYCNEECRCAFPDGSGQLAACYESCTYEWCLCHNACGDFKVC